MKQLKRILSKVVLVGLGIVLAAEGYLLVRQHLLGEQMPGFLGFRQAVAVSGSMEPAFAAGDYLLYRERPSYQKGEVVLFSQEGSLITHRIVGEYDGQFQTKGDANNTVDEKLVSQAEVLGELILVLPGVGHGILFFRTPFGMLLLLGGAAILIGAPHIRKKESYRYCAHLKDRGSNIKRD